MQLVFVRERYCVFCEVWAWAEQVVMQMPYLLWNSTYVFTRYGETFDYQIQSMLNVIIFPYEEQKKVVITGWILCWDCIESIVTVGVMVIMMISLLSKDTSVPVVTFATKLMTLTSTYYNYHTSWHNSVKRFESIFVTSFWIRYLDWA
jgi:hypothetical protein